MKRLLTALPFVICAMHGAVLGLLGQKIALLRQLSLAGLLLMCSVLYALNKRDNLTSIHKGLLLYLLLTSAFVWFVTESAVALIAANPVGLLYVSLFLVACIPALFRKNFFTEYFARKTNPPAVWESLVFKKINRNMTWIWIGIFATCALSSFIPDMLSMKFGLLTGLAFQMALPFFLILGIGVPLNRRYPDYYQRKLGISPVRQPGADSDQAQAGHVEVKQQTNSREEAMSDSWKVVVINGSPHMGIGNTNLMVQMMKPVLSTEGIGMEDVFLADKRIEYCIGCGLCLEKGRCWRQDDHASIIDKLLSADGIILASPVFFRSVTAQMKVFLDRSLAYGHKPGRAWKPGLAISVSAGMGECSTADYLASVLKVYGAFPIGTLTAIAVNPGAFLGRDLVEARARDLAMELARTIKEKRRYPATENDLYFYLFMGNLVKQQEKFMRDDYRHWEQSGLFDGFEAYVGQQFTEQNYDTSLRKEWLEDMIATEKARARGGRTQSFPAHHQVGPGSVKSCRELISMMPQSFNKEAAGSLRAVYQFEFSGTENFTSHLKISDGRCVYIDGPHQKPDVTVSAPADVWLAVSKGEMDGQAAFMAGKYRVEGDLTLLLNLKKLFTGS